MSIHISENLKRLRRSKGITQETLADIIGVSAQSVSRWECGENYPDITLLPAIASFFDVSTDVLLGMDELRNIKRVEEAHAKTDAIAHDWNHKNSSQDILSIWQELARDMPNNWEVQVSYARAIEVYADPTYIPAEDAENYKSKLLPMYERILENCTDDDIRCRAISWLTMRYCALDNLGKAREYADRLPRAASSREMAHYNITVCALNEYAKTFYSAQALSVDKDAMTELLKPLAEVIETFSGYVRMALVSLTRARASYGLIATEEHIELLELEKAVISLCCLDKPELLERGNVMREYYSARTRAFIQLGDLENAAEAAENFIELGLRHPWSETMTWYAINGGEDGNAHAEEQPVRENWIAEAESFSFEQIHKQPELQATPEKLLANHPRYIAALARLRAGNPS
ncbi:MAG: helix-turn-helix transcriptional regulator [Oscillospiraceae bacterium]|jgi:transcriptional regulator with XRE-family HTH domain|nr:helix-turn-helix transcriptional regulator [Oscillospiraceae bacterium]